METADTEQTLPALPAHLRLAENGKLLALAGRHPEALLHYREATRMAVAAGAAPAFARHYTWCALESLERMGAHAEVVATCERAEAHYGATPSDTASASPLARRDRAGWWQRRGVNLLLLDDRAAAATALAQALALGEPRDTGLSRTLHAWLRTQLRITPARVRQEQDRAGYWVVRADTVRADIALALLTA